MIDCNRLVLAFEDTPVDCMMHTRMGAGEENMVLVPVPPLRAPYLYGRWIRRPSLCCADCIFRGSDFY